MGTTMAFYHVKNNGFDRNSLQSIMEHSFPRKEGSSSVVGFLEKFTEIFGEEKVQQMRPDLERAVQFMQEKSVDAFSFCNTPQLPSPMIAYREDAPWLPFFDLNICDGYNASSKDARRLSKAFGVPVLAFSIFDSDVLMVSYSDAAQNIAYDYAKPNFPEMEEYDTGLFQAEFPQFLLELCPKTPEATLRAIWDGDEVFADDRMYKLGEVLGLSPIDTEVPEGFETIVGNDLNKKENEV